LGVGSGGLHGVCAGPTEGGEACPPARGIPVGSWPGPWSPPPSPTTPVRVVATSRTSPTRRPTPWPRCSNAAHHASLSITEVADWLYAADPSEPLDLLAGHAAEGGGGPQGRTSPWGAPSSVEHLAERERSSVYSTAQRVVAAYLMEGVRAAVADPNFDSAAFVDSPDDTLYIAAPDDVQATTAPVVVALLTPIKSAVYDRQRAVSAGQAARPGAPVQMILDEGREHRPDRRAVPVAVDRGRQRPAPLEHPPGASVQSPTSSSLGVSPGVSSRLETN
jgi:hypothetical protein